MSEAAFTLTKAPIAEAILDIECDLPTGQPLGDLEDRAKALFAARYPTARTLLFQQHEFHAGQPSQQLHSVREGIQALQFLQEDGLQLVQVRTLGFSFNRLAPYSSLDDYLPEIERTWRGYVGLASPTAIREIRLRYINRILLPLSDGGCELRKYLHVVPLLRDDGQRLVIAGFFNQQTAVEVATRRQVSIALMTQQPESGFLPLILDNSVKDVETVEPDDWNAIARTIEGLRGLKNHTFRSVLTEECLNLFR